MPCVKIMSESFFKKVCMSISKGKSMALWGSRAQWGAEG